MYLDKTNGSNALAFDSKGRLITVQRGPAHVQIGVVAPKGSEATLADNFEGNPNDLVVTRNGGVLHGARADRGAGQRPPSTVRTIVYYIAPGSGKAVKAADGITNPNGIQLSPDEKTLYVNNTRASMRLPSMSTLTARLGPSAISAK